MQISDLHYYEYSENSAILEDLANFKDIVDFLVVTGDLRSFGGSYDEASNILKYLMETFNLSEQDVFIVPGNHDVRREIGNVRKECLQEIAKQVENNQDCYQPYKKELYEAFDEYEEFITQLLNKKEAAHNQLLTWNGILNILQINTALVSDENHDKKQMVDLLGLSQLTNTSQNLPTIAIAHHDFYSIEYVQQNLVKRFLKDYHVKALLSGHIHREYKNVIDLFGTIIPNIGCAKSIAQPGDLWSDVGMILYKWYLLEPSYKVDVLPFKWSGTRFDPSHTLEPDAPVTERGSQQNASCFYLTSETSGTNKKNETDRRQMNYHLPNRGVPPPFYNFVGRDTEIEEIRRRLVNCHSRARLQIWGVGGIGKSELIAKICDMFREFYSEIHFWQWPEHYRTVNAIQRDLLYYIEDYPANVSLKERFRRAMTGLQKIQQDQLLVVDNVPEDVPEKIENFVFKEVLNGLPCHIIVGTRKAYTTFQDYELGKLDENSCRKLFEDCFGRKLATDEIDDYNTIAAWCDSHTLTIELAALTIKNKSENLKWLVSQLQERGLESTIQVKPRSYSVQRHTMSEHLSLLFKLQKKCTSIQIYVLKNLCLLPTAYYTKENLSDWLSLQGEILINTLKDLVERGYFQQKGVMVRMHPLIAEVTKKDLNPDWKSCSQMVKNIAKQMEIDLLKSEHATQKKELLPVASTIADYFSKCKAAPFAHLLERIGWFEFVFGHDESAKNRYSKAISILLKRKNKCTLLARAYNNCALAQRRLGQYTPAFRNHMKAFLIYKEGNNHAKLAEVYNDIGLVYYDRGRGNFRRTYDFEIALSYLKHSLRLSKKFIKKVHPDIATTYHNIGLVFYEMGEYEKAITNFKKAYKIRQSCLQPNHADILTTYYRAGLAYLQLNNPKCISYILEALKHWEHLFGKEHHVTKEMLSSIHEIKYKFPNVSVAINEKSAF